MDFKSELSLGQSRTFTDMSQSHSSIALAVCFGHPCADHYKVSFWASA